MNKQEFISLIEQPEQLGKSNISALKQVAIDFPYFQAAQVLLTKALYNDHHYEFEKHLKQTALMVPDRTVLFRYIHNLSDQQQPSEILAAEPISIVNTATSDYSIASPIANTPPPESLREDVAIPDEPETETVGNVAELSEIEKLEEPDALIENEPELSITESLPLEPVADEESSPVKEEPLVLATTTSESHSFTEWLQLQQGKKIVETNLPSPETEKIETTEPPVYVKETEAPDKTPMEAEIAEQVKRSNVNDFESILDKFIRENPRISRGKAEFYNPVNMAKQSVEEDDELVTETLANVYYKQGHYKKAIRAYEKLCLIYPHKMTYFASLIQKIKTETKE